VQGSIGPPLLDDAPLLDDVLPLDVVSPLDDEPPQAATQRQKPNVKIR
jgi:hypothetical protein